MLKRQAAFQSNDVCPLRYNTPISKYNLKRLIWFWDISLIH